uniref:Uncharacterized protein n=2 Tax=Picea TaxID=3328 RepID=A0A101M5K5_PICGL|nr:hypothetical protein ABT39_MTgene1087 [Picea glauca]QHR89981.1 hypothetical protein Q903MT_gene4003 [Picea sitchensis]
MLSQSCSNYDSLSPMGYNRMDTGMDVINSLFSGCLSKPCPTGYVINKACRACQNCHSQPWDKTFWEWPERCPLKM